MRIKLSSAASSLLLALLALASAGCVPSLQPLIDDAKATFDPGLVGTWVSTDHDTWRRLAPGETSTEERWIIERAGDDYSVKVVDDEDERPSFYHARTAKFSTGTYLELRADVNENVSDDVLEIHLIAPCIFYRIEPVGDELRHRVLNGNWLEDRLEAHAFRLPHEIVDGKLVITASTKQLQRFIERHGADPGAFVSVNDLD